MQNQNTILTLENLDEILSLNNVDLTNASEDFRRKHLLLVNELQKVILRLNQYEIRLNDNSRIMLENIRAMNEFRERQTAFDNRQNLFDLRLNTQDNKILFMSQQIENIKNEMARLGAERANTISPEDIAPEPYPGEEEFLKMTFLDKFNIKFTIYLIN
jgi:hypothetical protein